MARGALAFPVLPGKSEADVRRIAERFKEDPEGYWESRRSQGVSLERAYWQHTPMGDFVVAYLESTKGLWPRRSARLRRTTPPLAGSSSRR